MKRIILIYIISSFIYGNFSRGQHSLSGNAGIYIDFEEEVKLIYLSPNFGIFLTDRLLFEGGLTYVYNESDDYDESEITFNIGSRYMFPTSFSNTLYTGIEYRTGYSSAWQSSGSGALGGAGSWVEIDLDLLVLKLGSLNAVTKNFYSDYGMQYMTYVGGGDYSHKGIFQLFWGVSYFWG